MIQIDEAVIRDIILHKVGNDEKESIITEDRVRWEEDSEELLVRAMLLKPFLGSFQTFEFTHEIGLDYNVTFDLVRQMYQGDAFVTASQRLAHHLLTSSKHPNISTGDLFVVKFDDIRIGDSYHDAVGLFKFESKDNYIHTSIFNRGSSIEIRKGLGAKRPEKACLIVFTEEPYTVMIIDNNNPTDYWQREFLNIRAKSDDVNDTSNFLTLAKDYITDEGNGIGLSKADQIHFLNRSISYFKENDRFDEHEYENKVLKEYDLVDSFRRYGSAYRTETGVDPSSSFNISRDAVKKQARIFKSVLKLDKNFHVYIHGNRDLIERGVDPDGRKYYKLYFDQDY